MTDRTFGAYRMRLDAERTAAYFAALPLPGVACDCAGCRNFVRAVRTLPEAVTDFFAALGADPEKPTGDVCHYTGTAGSVFTSAWYHVCGELLAGDPAPGSHMRYGESMELADGFSASCATACDLLPEDFPRPCFQVELWCDRLPWLLEEPNPYADGETEAVRSEQEPMSDE